MHDFRSSTRAFLKHSDFVITTTLILALGIGANATIFSVVNAILVRPLPYKEPDRIVMIWETNQSQAVPRAIVSPANFLDWNKQNQVFEDLAAFRFWYYTLTGSGDPERYQGARVSASFFPLLGVRPEIGRNFRAEEEDIGRDHVVMLSHATNGSVQIQQWVGSDLPPLTNISHIWMFITIFFASAQAFNSVLPERGLFHWLFSFFFLWTLWNNLFSSFDTRRLLRSLTILFGTAFVLKHILRWRACIVPRVVGSSGWKERYCKGVTLGSVDTSTFAMGTGYIAFFTLALYVVGLILLALQRMVRPRWSLTR